MGFARTLNKEGKKLRFLQSLGVGVWMSMGAWTTNYGILVCFIIPQVNIINMDLRLLKAYVAKQSETNFLE